MSLSWAGPAGFTAGVYCARKLLKTLIISDNIGGQALESWAIENYMGYRMITGEDLMKRFDEQVRTLDVRLELDRVSGIAPRRHFCGENRFRIYPESKEPDPDAGQTAPEARVQDEEKYLGRGLSICSTCDGPLYKGKKVAVVGGGNSGGPDRGRNERDRSIGKPDCKEHDQGGSGYVKKLEGIKNITVHQHSRSQPCR